MRCFELNRALFGVFRQLAAAGSMFASKEPLAATIVGGRKAES
jgi:hypothetical protein